MGKRYERCIRCVRFTVKGLIADDARSAFLHGWHEEGLRDWEILSIIANAAINIRHPLPDVPEMPAGEMEQRFRAAFEVVEEADSALAPELFTDDMLIMHRRVFQVAFLRSWKLDAPSATSSEAAVEAFLVGRYGLRSDDVEHPDVFGWRAEDRAVVAQDDPEAASP